MQCNEMQCSTLQCNAMQCKSMQYNTIQCNAMQCNAMQCNAMQCNAMQCNAITYNTIQVQLCLSQTPNKSVLRPLAWHSRGILIAVAFSLPHSHGRLRAGASHTPSPKQKLIPMPSNGPCFGLRIRDSFVLRIEAVIACRDTLPYLTCASTCTCDVYGSRHVTAFELPMNTREFNNMLSFFQTYDLS